MFLHDYFLACEISTVRTQTLKWYFDQCAATLEFYATEDMTPQPITACQTQDQPLILHALMRNVTQKVTTTILMSFL